MGLIKRIVKFLVFIVIVVSIILAFRHTFKDMPQGLSLQGEKYMVPASAVEFFADQTFLDKEQKRQVDQKIFSEIFRMIRGAEHYILLDMFLFNSYQGSTVEKTRALSYELEEELLEKRKNLPGISITLITDPINEAYGGDVSERLDELRAAGIKVIVTNLDVLRDSNPIYSGLWRTVFKWFGNNNKGGYMPHPFKASDENGATLRTWLTLMNFKANHRKLLVADEKVNGALKLSTLITSANPHDGSSAHGNIAIKITESIYKDVIKSEGAVAALSGSDLLKLPEKLKNIADVKGEIEVKLLTEGAIKKHLLDSINLTAKEDTIDMAMFYLSERKIVNALVAAAFRGVSVRLILDPNKDAFGHKKNGVPNRPVAAEMLKRNDKLIQVRWCDTHGEQCHAKLVLIKTKSGYEMVGGSANLTRRNIDDYNLETDVSVRSREEIGATTKAYGYFNALWDNSDDRVFTTDYAVYSDKSFFKKIMYLVMEFTGMSSF